ncbi:hypothetical protein K1T71_001150 [Dendrolimus kikuchii]|uniref:Uncharacterized protein n=1 Tax=Dendrolimus kikuchii TaxID=765133 RepID=A0ACC1DHD7_9NEOP|nr:hypothetical protein K1T71_001150 [Dendrolimus kikuchii]
MDKLSAILSPLREEISSLKEAINFVDNKFESFGKRIDSLEIKMKSIASSTSELNDLKNRLDRFENDNNNKEQWSRRSNVEIYGIPDRKNENLINVIKEIADRCKFSFNPSTDIDFITRVAPKNKDNKQIKPIVVRFLARYRKDDFLALVRKLKLKTSDLGFSGSSPIHFNDHLTSANKSLLKRAKELAKEKNFMYVWVKNCSIMVRRSDTSPVIHIVDIKDLNKIK